VCPKTGIHETRGGNTVESSSLIFFSLAESSKNFRVKSLLKIRSYRIVNTSLQHRQKCFCLKLPSKRVNWSEPPKVSVAQNTVIKIFIWFTEKEDIRSGQPSAYADCWFGFVVWYLSFLFSRWHRNLRCCNNGGTPHTPRVSSSARCTEWDINLLLLARNLAKCWPIYANFTRRLKREFVTIL